MKTAIIPPRPTFIGEGSNLDFKAICIFAALGFFLDTDTFWIEEKTLPVASNCEINENAELTLSKPYFEWNYNPRNISFGQAVDEFAELFEKIITEQTKNKNVILPLSGGLDSRTQAAALKNIGANVNTYSYAFQNGHDETKYSEKVSCRQGFPFQKWMVKEGYLWNVIDDIAQINGCYSEFTHPRQMAFIDKYEELGNVFSLGHWGDVFYDDMNVLENLSSNEQVQVLLKKVVKKGGLELATALWKSWGLEGNFDEYLYERIKVLHSTIKISNSANARIRAFKSMYWAPRWTSVNLSIFESVRPITMPYYDNRMCEFICTVPEEYLAGRQIQIEYLKRNAPQIAQISWETHRPFNLYNYHWDKVPWNLPYRAYNKTKRTFNRKKNIQRNWELQFLGDENDKQLKARLFDERRLTEWIPIKLIQEFYNKFKAEDSVNYSHSVSMLLTLSLFSKHFKGVRMIVNKSKKGNVQVNQI